MMKLQVALDFLELDEAMAVTAKIADQIDIIEIGTPLIIRCGLEAVRRARELFPEKTILADLKIADAGAEESQLALDAGADIVTVLATASDNTIRRAAEAVHAVGRQLLADLVSTKDIIARASELRELGADYLCLHTAFDDESSSERSYELLAELKGLPGIRVTVAGGINPSSIRRILPARPDVVIVGRGLTAAADPARAAGELREAMAGAAQSADSRIDLTDVAGLEVALDRRSGRLIFGQDVAEVEPSAKKTEALKPVLLDPDGSGSEIMYRAYRGVARQGDLPLLEQHRLRHDVIVMPPGKIGREYAKTTGHGHPPLPGREHTYPELYFVLHGTAHYLCQKVRRAEGEKPEVLDAFCLVARAGEVVFIPPDYEHLTVNASEETLVTGNWAGTTYQPTYEAMAASRGACYYLVKEDGTLAVRPNDHYRHLGGDLEFRRAEGSLAIGLGENDRPYPAVAHSPERFDYLIGRGRYDPLLGAWSRVRAYELLADGENPASNAQTVLDELGRVAKGLKQPEYEAFVRKLLGARSVYLTGQGRSLLVAQAFAMRLMHMGLSSHVLGGCTTPSIGPGDVLIACSGSGTTAITLLQAESAQKAGAAVIAVTCKPDSPLGRLAQPAIHLPAVEKANASAASRSVQLPGTLFEQALLVYFDAAVITLRKVLNKSNADMMRLHANIE